MSRANSVKQAQVSSKLRQSNTIESPRSSYGFKPTKRRAHTRL